MRQLIVVHWTYGFSSNDGHVRIPDHANVTLESDTRADGTRIEWRTAD